MQVKFHRNRNISIAFKQISMLVSTMRTNLLPLFIMTYLAVIADQDCFTHFMKYFLQGELKTHDFIKINQVIGIEECGLI